MALQHDTAGEYAELNYSSGNKWVKNLTSVTFVFLPAAQ